MQTQRMCIRVLVAAALQQGVEHELLLASHGRVLVRGAQQLAGPTVVPSIHREPDEVESGTHGGARQEGA